MEELTKTELIEKIRTLELAKQALEKDIEEFEKQVSDLQQWKEDVYDKVYDLWQYITRTYC